VETLGTTSGVEGEEEAEEVREEAEVGLPVVGEDSVKKNDTGAVVTEVMAES